MQFEASESKGSCGNYQGYYAYRTDDSNARIQTFPRSLFHNKKFIDIGCNSGDLTMTIARKFQPQMILGIDIDPDLIDKAKKKLNNLILHGRGASSFLIPRSIAVSKQGGTNHLFPHNIAFETGDLLEEHFGPTSEASYNTVVCMSVVKWVHLNAGALFILFC